MIRSMTGYGRCEVVDEQKKIVLEIKSVNNRYCDITVKLPRAYGYVEDKIKERILREISRGKVDVYLYIEQFGAGNKVVTVDSALANSYLAALRQLGKDCGVPEDITVMGLARFSDIFVSREEDEDKDAVWAMVSACLEPALSDFVAMRAREGERMLADIRHRADNVRAMVAQVEVRAPKVVEEYAAKQRARMEELLGEFPVEESRLLTEVAIMADRVCISEELVRLKSHFAELDKILASGGPIGRKLDFLVQEMNRETNTIGSKANDADSARMVVDMKAELEKFREQIQNIE